MNRLKDRFLYKVFNRNHKHIFLLAIVLLTGMVAYANSLNVPFQFDDRGISNKTQVLNRLYSVYSKTARQVTDSSFLLNHYIHGNNVLGFHLLNLMIHLCCAVIMYFLISASIHALVGDELAESEESRFIQQFIPFASALIFVCHPVQTQAVTYIVQRYTSLATLFYLLSMLMYLNARICHVNGSSRVHVLLAGIVSAISGLLAMRCKEIAFTLPLMLIIVEMFVFHGRLLRSKTFLAGLAVLLMIIPAQQILCHGNPGINDLIYGIDRGTREELTYSRVDYLLTQFRVVVTYIRLLLLPVNQNLDYDYPLQKAFFTLPVISSLIFHIFMLSSAAFMFFKSRVYLKDRHIKWVCFRLCSFGIAWFYTTLLVESSIIPIVDVIFEHRLYLPSIGFILAVASASVGYFAQSESTRKRAWITLSIICLVLTTATIRRNTVWNDELRLWEDTASKSPYKPRVLNNLATSYLNKHKPEKAAAPLLRALDREPGSTESLNNIGLLLDQIPQAKGRYNNGTKFLKEDKSVDIRLITLWYANTRNNIGLVHELNGDLAKALKYYEEAAGLAPGEEMAWLNLAFLSAQNGNNLKAAEALNKLRYINPPRAKNIESYLNRNQ